MELMHQPVAVVISSTKSSSSIASQMLPTTHQILPVYHQQFMASSKSKSICFGDTELHWFVDRKFAKLFVSVSKHNQR